MYSAINAGRTIMSLLGFSQAMEREAFTEQGTCPHCGYYVDDDCTNDEYCAVKDGRPMKDKDRAKMLINMHLGVKNMFRPKSPGLDF